MGVEKTRYTLADLQRIYEEGRCWCGAQATWVRTVGGALGAVPTEVLNRGPVYSCDEHHALNGGLRP